MRWNTMKMPFKSKSEIQSATVRSNCRSQNNSVRPIRRERTIRRVSAMAVLHLLRRSVLLCQRISFSSSSCAAWLVDENETAKSKQYSAIIEYSFRVLVFLDILDSGSGGSNGKSRNRSKTRPFTTLVTSRRPLQVNLSLSRSYRVHVHFLSYRVYVCILTDPVRRIRVLRHGSCSALALIDIEFDRAPAACGIRRIR